MLTRTSARTVFGRLAVAAALIAALSGCQTLQDEHQNYKNRQAEIVNVVGNTWRVSAVWPNAESAKPLSEWLYERAKDFCGGRDAGMMPLQGASEDGSGDAKKPASGWLEFRCSRPEKVYQEYKGIRLHLDEFLEDEKDDKDDRRGE